MATALRPPHNPPTIPKVPWEEFLGHFEWEQGEHVTIVGPTGRGKTTLALALLARRQYVMIFANKRRDATMTQVVSAGYERQQRLRQQTSNRIVLWPNPKKIDAVKRVHREAFSRAIATVYYSGGWCVYWDEGYYLSKFLGLEEYMTILWQQGRSLGVSIIMGTQRPVHVPLYAYDSATHLFFFGDNDKTNIDRIGNLGGMNSLVIRQAVMSLDRHEVLYVNTREGTLLRTEVETGA